MIETFGTVLVLAPHTDDGEFGCGGTMARLREQGIDVREIAFSTASRSLPAGLPARHAGARVARRRRRARPGRRRADRARLRGAHVPGRAPGDPRAADRGRPRLRARRVLLPTIGDIHQDHATIAAEGLRAFKRTTVLGYEIPWNQFRFHKQAYVTLEERHLDAKVRRSTATARRQHRNYANEEYIRNLARTHGIEIGRPYAECFEVVRWVV